MRRSEACALRSKPGMDDGEVIINCSTQLRLAGAMNADEQADAAVIAASCAGPLAMAVSWPVPGPRSGGPSPRKKEAVTVGL